MSEYKNISNVTNDYLCRFYEILDQMISGMTSAELTNSISHNFIVQMIPHHQAAIEMSENILKYTTCLPLQEIAENIISEQTKSIENMRSALSCCSEATNSRQDIFQYQKAFSRITQIMFSEMRRACVTNNINANFMREMIPHHEGAIRMSENALNFQLCENLHPILSAIIVSQKKGVKKMERLLNSI